MAKKDKGLRKPSGFHWDLILCGALAFICSIFGLQWLCPAAVQSLSHLSSLTVMKKTVPGEAPRIDYVLEQRVTTIIIAILHGNIFNSLINFMFYNIYSKLCFSCCRVSGQCFVTDTNRSIVWTIFLFGCHGLDGHSVLASFCIIFCTRKVFSR